MPKGATDNHASCGAAAFGPASPGSSRMSATRLKIEPYADMADRSHRPDPSRADNSHGGQRSRPNSLRRSSHIEDSRGTASPAARTHPPGRSVRPVQPFALLTTNELEQPHADREEALRRYEERRNLKVS
jgi:hypothetical protein